MKAIPQYHFYKTKYGEELLIDVVSLSSIRKYLDRDPYHILSYFDITFITRGAGFLTVEGKPYPLAPGDVVFSDPGEIREWDMKSIPEGYALIFEEEFLSQFFNDSSFVAKLSFFSEGKISAKINIAPDNVRINDLLMNIRSEIDNSRSKDSHILRALLYEMLMLLNREYLQAHGPACLHKPGRHTARFIALVNNNFHAHHDTSYYAGILCITPNYLNEIVQRTIGTSAKRYIQNRIIREAKKLLTYTDLAVAEISDRLHFENPSYFIRLFRQHTGLTPLRYRNDEKR